MATTRRLSAEDLEAIRWALTTEGIAAMIGTLVRRGEAARQVIGAAEAFEDAVRRDREDQGDDEESGVRETRLVLDQALRALRDAMEGDAGE